VQVARGLFAAPRSTRFGPAPPTDKALMDAFLEGSPYVFTGSDFWNALGLGTTAVHAKTLVYNTKRSGELRLGGRPFVLRRVTFPESPPAEWYIIDLFEHAGQAATSPDQLAVSLERALRVGRFDREQLKAMSSRYGSRRTQKLVSAALKNAGA
jgi:hypothetical protein